MKLRCPKPDFKIFIPEYKIKISPVSHRVDTLSWDHPARANIALFNILVFKIYWNILILKMGISVKPAKAATTTKGISLCI